MNTVVGTIAGDGEAAAAPAKAAPAAAAPLPAEKKEERSRLLRPPKAERPALRPAQESPAEEDEEARSSPLVRKIAREHNINLSQVSGTGLGGRITKQDILAFIERASASAPAARQRRAPQPAAALPSRAPRPRPAPAAFPGDLVPMTNMRNIIAQRMIESRRTSAHVHCMFEVDFTRIVNLRNKLKSDSNSATVRA